MRPLTFTFLFIFLVSFNASAQLSITPQVGLENTKTTVYYNDLTGYVPLAGQVSPQLALRAEYKFKQQHGPFIGVSTSRSLVSYQFDDPEKGMKIYKATAGDMQLRLEGGYQFSSRPFYFTKSSSKKSPAASAVKASPYKSYNRAYGGYYSSKSQCGRSYSKARHDQPSGAAATQASKTKEKGWYMAIQPLIGAAVIPSVNGNLQSKSGVNAPTYLYNAGNWNSALITGAGFEFGQNVQKKFVITVQYLKGLGNLDQTHFTSVSGAKQTTTSLNSDVSAWSVRAGIPIALTKKKPAVKQVVIEQPRKTEKKCGEYKRCGRVI
jgi:hypothetical protein